MNSLVVFAVLAGPGILGTWKMDPKSPNKVQITFLKGGMLKVHSSTVDGVGTYRLRGDRLTIALTKRNGFRPTAASEKGAEGRVVEGGKAILLPSGQSRNGVPVMMRLVRA